MNHTVVGLSALRSVNSVEAVVGNRQCCSIAAVERNNTGCNGVRIVAGRDCEHFVGYLNADRSAPSGVSALDDWARHQQVERTAALRRQYHEARRLLDSLHRRYPELGRSGLVKRG